MTNRSELGRKGAQVEDQYGNDLLLIFTYIVIIIMAHKHEKIPIYRYHWKY